MRTIKGFNEFPQEKDFDKFPDSTILNETETNNGTPVVREVYGDILTNIYAYLRDRKITANQIEDNEGTGYQFLESLKRNVNNLNDIEQILSKSGNTWSIPLDLSLLPDKCPIICISSENYDNSASYFFKGTGNNLLSFSSKTGFSSGDEVLLIIDSSGVRAINITVKSEKKEINNTFTVFGTPLSYIDGDVVYYREGSEIFTDKPYSFNLIDLINTLNLPESNSLNLFEVFKIDKYLLSVVFDSVLLKYYIFKTDIYSKISVEMTLSGFNFNDGVDYKMSTYFDGKYLYFTNEGNSNRSENIFSKVEVDLVNNVLTPSLTINLNSFFKKTSNLIVYNSGFYTFINGNLEFYSGSNSSKFTVGYFNSFVGNLFVKNKEIYYTNGEVATKWNLSV